MSRLLAAVTRTIQQRDNAHTELRHAILKAWSRHSWAEIAAATKHDGRPEGLSRAGVRYLATREEKPDDKA